MLTTPNMKISELAKIKVASGSRNVETPKIIIFSVIMVNSAIMIYLDLVIVKRANSQNVTNVKLSMCRRKETVVMKMRSTNIRS